MPSGVYKRTEEAKRNIRLSKMGTSPWNKGKKLSIAHRKRLSLAHMGLPSPKKGKQYTIRKPYRIGDPVFRKLILERDKYTCQLCGKKGGRFHVDHIMPYSLFPALRTEPSNARTLCIPCHRKTDTYGRRIHGWFLANLTKCLNEDRKAYGFPYAAVP